MKQIMVEVTATEEILKELREISREIAQQAALVDDIQLRLADINETFVLRKDFDNLKDGIKQLDEKFVTHSKLRDEISNFQQEEAELLMHFNGKIREMNMQFTQVASMRNEIEILAKDVGKEINSLHGLCRELSSLKSEIITKKEFSKEIDLLKENSATESQLKNSQAAFRKEIEVLRKEFVTSREMKDYSKKSGEEVKDIYREISSLKRSVGSNKKGFLRLF